MRATGVLVMAHGTPESKEQIERFYTSIRRGRPPTPEQLADLQQRYEAIGGLSPLSARTRGQVEALANLLAHESPGGFVVAFGAKHTEPSIEAGAIELVQKGVGQVVGLVLTPHRSTLGSGEYLRRAADALANTPEPPEFIAVEQWYDAPGFTQLMAKRVTSAIESLDLPAGRHAAVVFTAHSLPQRVVAEGDPYPEQVADSAALIALSAKLDDYRVAWQSAGRTPEPWIGPELSEVLSSLAADGRHGVVVCPVGFVSDHLEILYDLDVEAREIARGLGLGFARTASLNDDPRFVRVLADVVHAAVGADSLRPERL